MNYKNTLWNDPNFSIFILFLFHEWNVKDDSSIHLFFCSERKEHFWSKTMPPQFLRKFVHFLEFVQKITWCVWRILLVASSLFQSFSFWWLNRRVELMTDCFYSCRIRGKTLKLKRVSLRVLDAVAQCSIELTTNVTSSRRFCIPKLEWWWECYKITTTSASSSSPSLLLSSALSEHTHTHTHTRNVIFFVSYFFCLDLLLTCE